MKLILKLVPSCYLMTFWPWPKSKSEVSQASLLLAHWYSKELVAFPVKMSVAPGVSLSVFGSSGTFVRKQSKASLNCSIPQFFTFLTFLGREFHNFGPDIWKLCLLHFWTSLLPLNFGTSQIRPLLSSAVDHFKPEFGTNPSIIFQM